MKRKKKDVSLLKYLIYLLIALVVIVFVIWLASPKALEESSYAQIKFADMYESTTSGKVVSQTLKDLDGQKVKMSGYMAEQSPVDESFIYLVSQPYVVCPFCTVGDISMLEVMYVSMANGATISFRNTPVDIYGTLEVTPKEDAFGYTTQFRIVADRVVNLEESVTNSEVDKYYNELNEKGMIFDIQTLQMSLDSIINPEAIEMYYETTDPVTAIDRIKEDTMWDYTQFIGYPNGEETGMQGYVNYIKECPAIIETVNPTDEKLKTLNEELIDIYEKQITLMEEIAAVVDSIKSNQMTDDEKTATYNELVSYCDRNLKLYEEFTAWNNKLRE